MIPFLKRIDRYLIAKFLGTYFFSIILIISIAVVFDFNENVDRFTTHHATWHAIIFNYYLNFIPYFTNLFSALFVFLSVIFFTSKLADNSEIIAMISTGLSFRRLMRPYMISSAIIACMSFYLGSEVIPRGSVKRLAFENQYKRAKKNPTYADNVQLQVDTGVIAFMEHFNGLSRSGSHFSLDKFESKKLVSHLTARTVVYDTLSDVRYKWQLHDVTIRELRGMREKITHHDRLDSVITMEPQDFLFIRDQQETMTTRELREYIEKQRIRGSGNLKAFQVEYYKRYASPFAAFILSTIGLSLSSRKRKGGMGLSLGIGIALSAAYIFLQGVSATFSIQAGLHPALAAWLPNILFFFIAWYLYRRAPR
ncbi:MAG: LptF/LptG family permease [Bacteroidaceae bacterium]|nr:LptF/LptG family permease [Bacteroidaceae bacterium]